MPKKLKILEVKLSQSDINNQYRPNSTYDSESFDEVRVKDSLNKKFAPILLKEWFFLLKPSGQLVIEYTLIKDITFDYLEYLLWWLFRGNYDIKIHSVKRTKAMIVVQKKRSMFARDDAIDKWTFGIITNGERDDWMEEIIESIYALKIPNFEIIVCGKYKDRPEKNYTYINFNERADKGWISKKKNLICQRAKYENIIVIHDRLVFDKNWYKGVKKYGNAFELLGCVQIDKGKNIKAGDWLTLGGKIYTEYKISQMHYTDWDYYTYLSGQLTIIKKSIWQKVLWDETRYWNGAEDADISFRARDLGFLIRFNPYSICNALAWRHGKIPLKYNINEGLLPKDMYFRRIMRVTGRVLNTIPFVRGILVNIYIQFAKTPLHRFLLYGQ